MATYSNPATSNPATFHVYVYKLYGHIRDGYWAGDWTYYTTLSLDPDADDPEIVRALKKARIIRPKDRLRSYQVERKDGIYRQGDIIFVNKITTRVLGFCPVCYLVRVPNDPESLMGDDDDSF